MDRVKKNFVFGCITTASSIPCPAAERPTVSNAANAKRSVPSICPSASCSRMWRRNLKKPDIRRKTIWKTDQRRLGAPLILFFWGADLGVRGRLTAPKFQKIIDGHGGDVVERFLRQKRLM